MLPRLRRSIKLAYFKNATYDQIVAHLAIELEPSGIENDAEQPVPTMAVAPTKDTLNNFAFDNNVTIQNNLPVV